MIQRSTFIYFFLSLTLLILAVGACVFLLVRIRSLEGKTALLLSEIEGEYLKVDLLESATVMLSETESLRGSLERRYVGKDEEAEVAFLQELENLGKLANVAVDIKNLSHTSISGSSRAETVSMVVEARGEGKNVFHFLSLLETFPYRLELPHVLFERVNDETSKIPQWRVSLSMSILKLK